MRTRIQKLNQIGFTHWILPLVVIAVIGSIGGYLVTKSNANQLSPSEGGGSLPACSRTKAVDVTMRATATPALQIGKTSTITMKIKNNEQKCNVVMQWAGAVKQCPNPDGNGGCLGIADEGNEFTIRAGKTKVIKRTITVANSKYKNGTTVVIEAYGNYANNNGLNLSKTWKL